MAEAVVVGAAAAAAVCLKPHSVLAPMLVEALSSTGPAIGGMPWRRKIWRPSLSYCCTAPRF